MLTPLGFRNFFKRIINCNSWKQQNEEQENDKLTKRQLNSILIDREIQKALIYASQQGFCKRGMSL